MCPLSAPEVRLILEAADGGRNQARWPVALLLGLCQREALALQWGDIDSERATVSVRRALQRGGWAHGCRLSPCGITAWDCPARRRSGPKVGPPKSATLTRTIALPPLMLACLADHRRLQAIEQTIAREGWAEPKPGGPAQ